ncbi:hypothetical protein K3495_g12383 [Podosphaera aphanis]|nr:hypothetical protein K3495_g12383 [Podosphaera aphanis]
MAYNCNPSVLEYIANLNAIPPADIQSPNTDHFNLDDDLAMFSNAQFFDLGHDTDVKTTSGFDVETDLNMPLQGVGDFSFTDVSNFSKAFEPQGLDLDNAPTPTSILSTYNAESPTIGCKKNLNILQVKSSTTTSSPSIEAVENSRQAAEEDKRRRNTAASARFRVKKKQREQALEKSAKEMSDKVTKLENRIRMLETENKWLKDLITEKNDGKEKVTRADFEDFWKQFNEKKPNTS